MALSISHVKVNSIKRWLIIRDTFVGTSAGEVFFRVGKSARNLGEATSQ